MNNSRKFERFTPEGSGVFCELDEQPGGLIRDISIGGAGICFNRQLAVGSRCLMGVKSATGRFTINAEVVWVGRARNANCNESQYPFHTGLRFDQDSIEQSKDMVFALLNSN